jgi:hypothetical protein
MNILILLSFTSFTELTLPYNGKVFTSGTAFSTIKEEPENLFWNPAGMGKNAYITSAFNYSGLIFGSFGKIWELNSFNLGVGIQLMRSESITKTNVTGATTGSFNYQSAVPVISGNMQINKFIIGAKALVPYTIVDEYNSYGLGIDIGGIYSLNELLSFSVYIKNFGKEIKSFVTEKENLPTESRFGGLLEYNKIMFSLEYSSLLGECASLSYDVNKNFSFTAGYNSKIGKIGKLERIDSSVLSGFSLGINVKHHSLNASIGAIFCGAQGISKTLSISFIP